MFVLCFIPFILIFLLGLPLFPVNSLSNGVIEVMDSNMSKCFRDSFRQGVQINFPHFVPEYIATIYMTGRVDFL